MDVDVHSTVRKMLCSVENRELLSVYLFEKQSQLTMFVLLWNMWVSV